MLAFPCAKINLGLHVLGRRMDGYHDIETVLMPIPLSDVLEVIRDPEVPAGEIAFTRTGAQVPGDPMDDLCVKALRMLGRKHALPGLRMHLHKVIPIGAGLGGGSSDGACTLQLANELLALGLDQEELHAAATELGSDPAFFLHKGPQIARGRGEILEPIPLDLKGWWLVLINPGVHISTAEVYAHTPAGPAPVDLADVLTRYGPDDWTGRVVNVMEQYVLTSYPPVAAARQVFQDAGASFSAMSGSGSTVFGLFRNKPVLPALPDGHMSWMTLL